MMLLPRLLRSMLIVRGLVAESFVVMVAERDGFVRVGEEERVIVSGIGFAVAGLGAAVALSDGGGLVAL